MMVHKVETNQDGKVVIDDFVKHHKKINVAKKDQKSDVKQEKPKEEANVQAKITSAATGEENPNSELSLMKKAMDFKD